PPIYSLAHLALATPGLCFLFFFNCSANHPDLHSFPTRRSSDLRMPHDLSHLGFLAGQIGRLITISTTPVIAGDSNLTSKEAKMEIGRAVQQECRDRYRMPSSA